MGFAPLPFDGRSPCFCHQNCGSFRQPTFRWWVTFTSPPVGIPQLGTGVLMEFTTFTPGPEECLWEPVVLPVGVTFMLIARRPTVAVPGPTYQWETRVVTPTDDSECVLPVNGQACNIIQEIPALPPPKDVFGDAKIFPVRWYQNANDVPH